MLFHCNNCGKQFGQDSSHRWVMLGYCPTCREIFVPILAAPPPGNASAAGGESPAPPAAHTNDKEPH